MAELNDLPDELLEFIMSYLPPYKDMENCMIVCKRWNILVKNVMRHTKINFNKGLTEFRVCWKTIDQPLPLMTPFVTGRFSHSAAIHNHKMFIFGGRSSTSTTFNDLWCFDLSKRHWVRPLPMGSYPSPKACATFVCYKNLLILFGGVRHPAIDPPYQLFKLFDELHVYNVTENRWTLHTSDSNIPLMAGHSASTRKNQMIIFGGFQKSLESEGSSNDIWCLNLTTMNWHKQLTSEKKPQPRYGQFQVTLDEDNLLILGGCGGPNNIFNDAWILNMKGDKWEWKSVFIKNKKWSPTHMWCYPACKVGSKLVVLGPTPVLPSDFQIVRQQKYPTSNRTTNNLVWDPVYRRDVQQQQPQHQFQPQQQNQPQHQFQPQQPNQLQNQFQPQQQPIVNNRNAIPIQRTNSNIQSPTINNNQQQNQNNDEAAIRLKRNLQQLRNYDDEYLLPKRFNEPYHNQFRMAAFSVNKNVKLKISNDLQTERLKRMENKFSEIRRMYKIQQQKKDDEPLSCSNPKRIKRNSIAMFICDLNNLITTNSTTTTTTTSSSTSTITNNEPILEWLEYKNYGIMYNAPERLILSTIVEGNGELIMFGGLFKESLSNDVQLLNDVLVSNSIHFLTVPKGII